jgi:hypothetical protein
MNVCDKREYFFHGSLFQPSLNFEGKVPALLIHIRLRWNGLPGTNTLAYYEQS